MNPCMRSAIHTRFGNFSLVPERSASAYRPVMPSHASQQGAKIGEMNEFGHDHGLQCVDRLYKVGTG